MKRIVNNRPIVFMALLFIIGVAASYYLKWAVEPLVLGIILAGIGFAIVLAFKKPQALWFLYLAVFFLGAILFQVQYNIDYSRIKNGGSYEITGRVSDVVPGNYTAYTIQDAKLESEAGSVDFASGILLYSKERLQYGDTVKFTSKIEIPSTTRNPGTLDNKMFATAKGVGATCFAPEVQVTGSRPGPYGFFLKTREGIAAKIDQYFTESTAPVAKAMFLGLKNDLPDELRDGFGVTGIAHVLAISGLHIGIIAALFQVLLKKIKTPRNLRFSINIAVLIFYALITGLAPSVLRAVIMAVLVLLGRWLFVDRDSMTFLAIALFITLIPRTAQLFMPGFLMSYAVVFGLLCLVMPLKTMFDSINFSNKFSEMLSASGAASLSVFPITAYYFNSISISAVLANFFAIPLTTVIVVFTGLFSISCMIPAVAAVLAIVPQICIELLIWLNSFMLEIGFGSIATIGFSVIAGILVFVLLFVCSDYLFVKKGIKAIICALLICGICMTWSYSYTNATGASVKMTILDVGTGDIVHINTEQGDCIIDNGGNPQRSKLTEYTEKNKISYDFALVTNDRTNNLADIAQQGLLECMLVPENFERKDYDEKIPLKEYLLYDKIDLGNATLELVASDGKNYSVMLRINDKPACLLAQNNAETLVLEGIDHELPILKLAKGGRADSLSVDIIEDIKPECAVISVKVPNKDELPDSSVINLLKKSGIDVYQTAIDGAVTIEWDKYGKYKISSMK